MHKRYRLTSPLRFIVMTFICMTILIFGVAGLISSTHTQAASFDTFAQVEITENDTLWNIANDYCESNMDVRDVVADICEINDISAGDIQPGDIIFVPVYS